MRLVNPANEAEIPEDLSEIAAARGFESGNLLDAVKRVVSHLDDMSMESLDVLSKFLGDEGCLYFACKGKTDADELLQRYRARRAKEEAECCDSIDDCDEDDSSDAVIRPLHSCVTSEIIIPRSVRGYAIENEKCIRCAACYSVCPVDAIEGNMATSFRIVRSRCKRCGKCVEACDYSAIVKMY